MAPWLLAKLTLLLFNFASEANLDSKKGTMLFSLTKRQTSLRHILVTGVGPSFGPSAGRKYVPGFQG
jgi:hypothetical protein